MCWGANSVGELGDGSVVNHDAPALVKGLGAGARDIAAHEYRTCASLDAGGVKCWGNGTVEPTSVPDLTAVVDAVCTGNELSCARLASNGSVACWGTNFGGSAVALPELGTGVLSLSCGRFHACAVTNGGAAKCWGANFFGQLGDGSTTTSWTAVGVSGLDSEVAEVAAGSQSSCARLAAGGVRCWGLNSDGQLGDGTTVDSLVPVEVTGLSSTPKALTVGWSHACALLFSGGVECWGLACGGLLGNGAKNSHTTPVDVAGLGTGVRALSAGYYHSCAVTASGEAKCWGLNDECTLGGGYSSTAGGLVAVSGLPAVQEVAAGAYHSCARTEAGDVKCWGRGNEAQLGRGSLSSSCAPVSVAGLADASVRTIRTGPNHTCALLETGEARCWGYDPRGQLACATSTGLVDTACPVAGLGGAALAGIAPGASHTCAVTTGGAAKCWGANFFGQLGDGSTSDRNRPVGVIGLGAGVAGIFAGTRSPGSCAVTDAGAARCWGYNASGQVGDGAGTADRTSPAAVFGLPSGVAALARGDEHTCALLASGRVKCWGGNRLGQLGDGTFTDRPAPVDVAGLDEEVRELSAGSMHTCVLTSTGRVKCWGADYLCSVGAYASSHSPVPARVHGFGP